jgi:Ca2+-transporting ATPase
MDDRKASLGRGRQAEDWTPHALTAEEVLERLGTDPDRGLTQAQVVAARARFGENRLPEVPGVPLWRRVLGQFQSIVVIVLLAAALIAGLLGEAADAVAILAIVALNAILGFAQEERASRAIAALKRVVVPAARVIRDGSLHLMPASELVPGDLIDLEAGDRVPADARLVRAVSLRADESVLTGESRPVSKRTAADVGATADLADRVNCLHMGTAIAGGKATAVITATGAATELGAIARLLEDRGPRPTPLQLRMDQLGRVLLVVVIGIIAVISLLQLLRGGRALEVFLLSVSLAVAAVPEGLPAVVTVALAVGMHRMARRQALVRRLPSIETLGGVDVICSDKTGTLTRNEMMVCEIVTGSAHYMVAGSGFEPRGTFHPIPSPGTGREPSGAALGEPGPAVEPTSDPDLRAALAVAARCNDARLAPPGNAGGDWELMGDPTEGALLVAALKASVEGANEDRDVVFEIPFEPERRAMSVAVREGRGGTTLHTKGAPEVVLPWCTEEQVHGQTRTLTEERRAEILAIAGSMANRALRVLALAYLPVGRAEPPYPERNLIFTGLAGMIDPPRGEVAAAVATCRAAGIRPVMITGDHPATALRIARDLGIAGEGDRVVTGSELNTLDDEALAAQVASTPVYARVSAEHKLRVVRGWKARGATVAMTGDGVNDAAAIRLADIGIAMGRKGTDVTRDAADMVLLDDNFATIVAAVEEGRGIFDNIQKFVHYLLATNAGEVLLMFFAAAAGWPVPLLATQILWINLVTDGLPALALGVEPVEADVMRRAPHERGRAVISAAQGRRILLRGVLVAAAATVGFALAHAGDPGQLPHARAVAFTVAAFSQLLYAAAFRSERATVFQLGLFTNRALIGAIAIAAMLQLAAVELPFMQELFGMRRPIGGDWLLVIALAATPVTLVEAGKLVSSALRPRGDRPPGAMGAPSRPSGR